MNKPSLMLFTRDLRTRDNPALSAACAAGRRVVPLFVHDDALANGGLIGANRQVFLQQCLVDLHERLVALGGGLLVRRGDWVGEVLRVANEWEAGSIHVADDVSTFARHRLNRLEREASKVGVSVYRHSGVTVVDPGVVSPASGDHYKVFTPYYRRWLDSPWRPSVAAPDRVHLVEGLDIVPGATNVVGAGEPSPDLMSGGETHGLARLRQWASDTLERYDEIHNDLAGDCTSRISPYLHFGCLSPLEVASVLRSRPGAAPFIRQLCWRDFYHQVLSARPEVSTVDYRSRGDVWNDDPNAFAAWKDGRTGYPLVDAGMRQLRREGFMHNRARMVVASFLTKDLYLDWRLGAAHFMEWLVDGDVANNQLNWQWTAGTGTDSNPNRIFNPVVQGQRFDPTGTYIRRYLPELGHLDHSSIHWPDKAQRQHAGYPAPIVDHREAIEAYRVAIRLQSPKQG